jgi:hypothetical protein
LASDGKTVAQLPLQANFFDSNDALIFLYGADSNSVAQTALINISSFANAFANSLQIPIGNDPANSTSLTISAGQIFASAAYLYVAIANNTTARVALTSF